MTVNRPVASFYTPLKHPFQSEASGDREIGRTLLRGLEACGYAPELASRMATWRRTFDPGAAARIERGAAARVLTLVRRFRRRPPERRPRLWMTYQNYYRAPDLLGPSVAAALDIPYVLVSPAVSRGSRRSPFRPWASAARLAVRSAALLFATSPRDVPSLARLRGERFAERRLLLLPPAVDTARFEASPSALRACRSDLARRFPRAEGPLVLCVAMMRVADKLDSYRLLAQALVRLRGERPACPWRLLIVGDGPARPAVEAAMASLPSEQLHFAGALPPEALPPLYLAADLFAFPGLGEDFGMVFLEAAAAGLPVAACHGAGPDFAVAPGGGLLTEPAPEAFAEGLRRLLEDPAERRGLGEAARRFVRAERSLTAFQGRLREGLARLEGP